MALEHLRKLVALGFSVTLVEKPEKYDRRLSFTSFNFALFPLSLVIDL